MFQFRAFPPYGYLIHRTVLRYCLSGFPHSEIPGSQLICSSPRLIAACRVLLRLLMPRHSPCALISFTCVEEICAPLHPPSGEYPFRSDPFSFPIQTRLRWALNRREEIVPISSDVFLVLELCRINRSLHKIVLPFVRENFISLRPSSSDAEHPFHFVSSSSQIQTRLRWALNL